MVIFSYEKDLRTIQLYWKSETTFEYSPCMTWKSS